MQANRLPVVDAYEAEHDALLKDFAATLREAREPRFPVLEKFAKASRLNRVHVYYLETGAREPSLSTLLILRDTLKVSLDELTGHLHAPKEHRPPPHRGKRPCAARDAQLVFGPDQPPDHRSFVTIDVRARTRRLLSLDQPTAVHSLAVTQDTLSNLLHAASVGFGVPRRP